MSDKKSGAKYRLKIEKDSNARLHIRRCHLCDEVTEASGTTVSHCSSCGKPMAPFYFFNELEAPLLTDAEIRPVVETGFKAPIRGLTAFW